MSTLTNIELRIDELENKVRRLECQTCSSPLFYDTFEDFPTEGRNGFLYVDKETGGIYIWNGEYITLYEEKICLNETEFVPTDVNNPTTEEVKIWTDANLSEVQKNNGTVLTYFVEEEGTCNEPDFTWTLNYLGKITLDYKRTYTVLTSEDESVSITETINQNGDLEYDLSINKENLTQGFIPYVSNNLNMEDSPIYSDGTNISIGTSNISGLLTLRKSISVTPFISLFDNYDTEIIRLNADHNTNLFIGSLAGLNNTPLSSTQGQENMFIGSQSGYNNTTGYANTFLGYQSGFYNTTGVTNINIGYSSGYNNQIGNYNVCIGVDAGAANIGSNNMFIGFHTGGSFTPQLIGEYNTFIGNEIGYYGTSLYQNTVVGNRAGYNLTTGYNNILNGYLSGFNLTTGYNNILSGVEAGTNIQTSYNNVYLGFRSGFYANNSSYHNIGIGSYSLFSNTSGNQNVGIGDEAGFNITTGTNNTFIGNDSGNNALQKVNAINSTAIGNGTYTDKNNQVVYGNNDIVEHLFRSGKLIMPELQITNIQTYADDTEAGTGGLISGSVYKTASGELRIKL